jgi:7,8-dihydroneopterin aldolase/epimerase/oxygenase
MDIVFIRGLEVRAIIGVRDWERQVKQTVVLNLEMETDVQAAAATDDLDGTLSYSDVADALETFVGNSSFQLIETLAEQAAALVMAQFGVGWLRLELIKPMPLIGRHVVGVVIERGVRVADGAQVGTGTTDRPAPPAPG